ncbi:sialin-like isoform X1 [Styela clava]
MNAYRKFQKSLMCCNCLPQRWILCVMSFFGTFTVYSLRVNLSSAIVSMVDYEKLRAIRSPLNNSSSSGATQSFNYSVPKCENVFAKNATEPAADGWEGEKFLWDGNMQGLALGSYFYGYICSQTFGTWIARKLGRVRVFGFCILSASVFTIILPFATQIGFPVFVATRILIGFFSGVSYPILQAMWTVWAPSSERSKFLSIQYAGGPFGNIIVWPLAGLLQTNFGWESVFYITGMMGCIWFVFWWVLIYDSPAEHPLISEEEKRYIQDSLGYTGNDESINQRTRAVPWKTLLGSIRVWSVIIPQFTSNFLLFVFLTMLPTYLRTVLNFDIKGSAVLSAIPYMVKFLTFLVVGLLADWVISLGVKPIYVRKLWTSIGMFVPGLTAIIAAYMECNIAVVLLLFTLTVATDAFNTAGFKTAMIEMAPAFAGIIYSFANTIATSSGFIAPQVAGGLLELHQDDPIQGWRSLFWLASVVIYVGCIFFLVFGISHVQKWAKTDAEIEKDNMQQVTEETSQNSGQKMNLLI